ncbi:two pore domain potassium channel family protein [Microvirga massiliensis]|uniref:two pore domain potassium channel family protein n=1 Tax=Microvirga massiliensis TaxID=1033741 RepID=UPI00069A5614|nr:two pore domain potassium channel family protein [Microvirga massiliensis]
MNALRASLRCRGLIYIVGLTVAVALLRVGGMLAFEPASKIEGGFTSYPDALWWTGMLLTIRSSELWQKSVEGRILCFLLALYGFAVFTASLALLFVEGNATSPSGGTVGTADVAALHAGFSALRAELAKRIMTPAADLSKTERVARHPKKIAELRDDDRAATNRHAALICLLTDELRAPRKDECGTRPGRPD